MGTTPDGMRPQYLRALRLAADLYHQQLVACKDPVIGPYARNAREYLRLRGVRDDDIASWHLGYAPPVSDFLYLHLLSKGFLRETLEELHLIKVGNGGSRDRHMDRIIYPLHNIAGEIVGLHGRSIAEPRAIAEISMIGELTFMSSFMPSLHGEPIEMHTLLYGLRRAIPEIVAKKYAIVTDGQMDVITAYRTGIGNAVGTMGRELTPTTAALLARYTDRIQFCMGADCLSLQAVKYSCENAMKAGIAPSVTLFDSGDLDELLRSTSIGERALSSLKQYAPEEIDAMVEKLLRENPGVIILPRLPSRSDSSYS